MKLLTRSIGRFPLGIWIALAAILLILLLAWGGQFYSLMDWDGAVNMGLQNERFGGDPAEDAWARESRGLAMADMLWPLPIAVMALIGLLRRRFFGLVAGFMELAIGVYFPLFFAFQRWETFRGTAVTALLLWALPSLIGIAGLWVNRREFRIEE
jgi:hypothetical protein